MKFRNLLLSLILVISLFAFTSCKKNAPYEIEYNLSLNVAEVTLELDQTFNVVATYGDEQILYTSSNQEIATVDTSGKITAKSVGVAYVTVAVKDRNVEKTILVNVIDVDYSIALVDYVDYDVFVNAERTLQVETYKNAEKYNGKVTWSVDKNGATIASNGKVAVFKASVKGVYKVTATTADGASVSVEINVIDALD
ncbi:MAG: Ig-like domain-containing protein [Clostridia bacterium]|nr:Ig-like domain-containing protein [Clostridia bacterium]